jgi:putative cell wall-binding protein
MDLRVRFVVSYQDSMGTYYRYASPWSKTVTFSNNQKAEDPGALINHAPVLKSADVRKFDEIPYLRIVSETPHENLKTLNSISGNSVTTEVWVKSETGDWELIHSNNFVEQFDANVLAYFGLKDSYDAAIYDVKMRYAFDYHSYPAAGKSGVIYSPFSNVISHGTPEYKTSRLSGASRIETAIAVSREGWPNGAGTVILTRDDNYPDALAGAPLSKKLDAPILFTNSQTLTAATKDEIIRLKAQKVIILGGTGAVSQGVENQLRQSYEVMRIGGVDRYETAAKIAKELGYKGKVVITTGEDFHDALVVSPLAAYNGIPILMTLPNSLPAATLSALDFIAPTEITIVGDTSSVSEKVASGLANAKRVSGSGYYRTAVSLARSFGADPGKVFLATGKDFPDALSGSALAAKYNSPILFVNDPLADEVKQYLMENKDKTAKVHLLGGEGAISTETKNTINQIYK